MRDFLNARSNEAEQKTKTKKKKSKKNKKLRQIKKEISEDRRKENWCKQKTEVSEFSKMCSVRKTFISVACSIILLL